MMISTDELKLAQTPPGFNQKIDQMWIADCVTLDACQIILEKK